MVPGVRVIMLKQDLLSFENQRPTHLQGLHYARLSEPLPASQWREQFSLARLFEHAQQRCWVQYCVQDTPPHLKRIVAHIIWISIEVLLREPHVATKLLRALPSSHANCKKLDPVIVEQRFQLSCHTGGKLLADGSSEMAEKAHNSSLASPL